MSPIFRKPDPVDAPNRVLAFFPASHANARTLNGEQIAQYNALGYVSPIAVYEPPQAERIRTYISDLLASVLGAGDRRNAYSINSYHHVCAGLWDIVTEPRIVDLVADILGPNFVAWGSHLFAKLPNDGKEVPFHQDAVYWPLTPSRTVTVWLAIDDADAGNAAMEFVPASHLGGPMEHEGLPLDGTRVLGRRARGVTSATPRFVNALRAGQASLHSDLLLHGSSANRSERRRAGLTLRYAAADVRLIDGYDVWRKNAVHLRGGDPDGFWYNRRRPVGEAPERMAQFWDEFDGQPLSAE
ncbi:MAG: phytanoyl-CoA dioxygenase family protein [Gammaproteobacteria bacterium]|nr:phytanoyl-CoA dioxygenase family protein [Gammaproteobacteria bacterium]